MVRNAGGIMKIHRIALGIILCVLFSIVASNAQSDMQQYNTMLLVDGSSHTNANWGGKSKLSVFRQALGEALVELNKSPAWGFNMGIRVFGDKSARSINDCLDARLGNKMDWFEPVVINSVAEGIRPKGKNCLAYGISTTKDDFPKNGKNVKNYLVCVISSRDECSRDEKETLNWIMGKASLDAVYIIGMNVYSKHTDYLNDIFKTIPGEFINVTSPTNLAPTLTTVLNRYCRGMRPGDDDEENAAKDGDAKTGSKNTKAPAPGKQSGKQSTGTDSGKSSENQQSTDSSKPEKASGPSTDTSGLNTDGSGKKP